MNLHHWTPGQIAEMDLRDFLWAVRETGKWQAAEAAAIAAATGGAGPDR